MKKRILFVDDDVDVLAGINRTFRAKSDKWDLEFVTSPLQARDMIMDGSFDAVVSDHRMPELSGDHLLKSIQLEAPNVIPFMLTGFATPELEREMKAQGVTMLTKPCNGSQLLNVIETKLSTARVSTDDYTARTSGKVFDGEIDLEEYLLILTGSLLQSRTLDEKVIPAKILKKIKRKNRFPRIDSLFLDHYEDMKPSYASSSRFSPEIENLFEIIDDSNGEQRLVSNWVKTTKEP